MKVFSNVSYNDYETSKVTEVDYYEAAALNLMLTYVVTLYENRFQRLSLITNANALTESIKNSKDSFLLTETTMQKQVRPRFTSSFFDRRMNFKDSEFLRSLDFLITKYYGGQTDIFDKNIEELIVLVYKATRAKGQISTSGLDAVDIQKLRHEIIMHLESRLKKAKTDKQTSSGLTTIVGSMRDLPANSFELKSDEGPRL